VVVAYKYGVDLLHLTLASTPHELWLSPQLTDFRGALGKGFGLFGFAHFISTGS